MIRLSVEEVRTQVSDSQHRPSIMSTEPIHFQADPLR